MARGFFHAFGVTLLFTFTGCYTPPKVQMVANPGLNLPCTGLEPSCRGMNVHIAIEEDKSVTLSKAEKKEKKSSVFGSCQLLVENAEHAPTAYPCTELRVSLTKTTGEERNTWLQGQNFEIRDLTRGPYVFNAYSDQYMTGASKGKINPGQPLKIEIRIRPPMLKTATEM